MPGLKTGVRDLEISRNWARVQMGSVGDSPQGEMSDEERRGKPQRSGVP